MSAKSANNPFAIQLEVEFLDRLSEPVREGRAKSVSDLIRTALERCDFDNILVMRPAQLMISVRLPLEIRRKLKELSKTKHASIGQLVRVAVEAYLPQLEHEAVPGGIEMPIPHVELPEETSDAFNAVQPAETPSRKPKKNKQPPRARDKAKKPSKPKSKPAAPAKKVPAKKTTKSPAPKTSPARAGAAKRPGMTRKRAQG